ASSSSSSDKSGSTAARSPILSPSPTSRPVSREKIPPPSTYPIPSATARVPYGWRFTRPWRSTLPLMSPMASRVRFQAPGAVSLPPRGRALKLCASPPWPPFCCCDSMGPLAAGDLTDDVAQGERAQHALAGVGLDVAGHLAVDLGESALGLLELRPHALSE